MIRNRLVIAIIVAILIIIVVIVITNQVADNNRAYVIQVDGKSFTHNSSARQVSEILEDAGVTTNPADRIYPAPTSEIGAETTISVTRANKVNLHIDGNEEVYWTLQDNLNNFLAEIGISLNPTTRIFADDFLVEPDAMPYREVPQNLSLVNLKTVEVSDGSKSISYDTYADTVGAALWENEIEIKAGDEVSPPLGTWLVTDQAISIKRASNYLIDVTGVQFEYTTHYTKVGDILSEFGLSLNGMDFSRPSLNSKINSGDTIEIIRVQHEYQISDEPIPYSSSIVPTEDLEIDQRALVSSGVAGIRRKLSRLTMENGSIVSERPAGEWLIQTPIDELIGYGTKIVVRTMDTPEGPIEYWRVVTMRATAYTAATSGKPPDHPAYGITASGVRAGTGVVAIDPNIVPFRSSLYIPGYGIAFAGDTGGAVKGRIIDLGYNEGELVPWSGFVDVYYLTPVPPTDSINYLIP